MEPGAARTPHAVRAARDAGVRSVLTPLLSVVVPAYNEGPAIAATVASLETALAALAPRYMAEIIVVDDASTDASAGVLRILAACGRIRLLRHDVNRGCARATATGLAAAGGAIVVTFDADCSYAPAYIGLLADALRERRAAIALASPYARGGRVSNVPPVRALASACANRLLCALSGNAASTFTGLVRAYDGAALRRLQFENVEGEFNATLLVRALRAGEPVVEVPAHLCWPAARRRAAGRMSARMLGRRTGFVLRTAWTLARSPRAR